MIMTVWRRRKNTPEDENVVIAVLLKSLGNKDEIIAYRFVQPAQRKKKVCAFRGKGVDNGHVRAILKLAPGNTS